MSAWFKKICGVLLLVSCGSCSQVQQRADEEIVSEKAEIERGQEPFLHLQQKQGGLFILDEAANRYLQNIAGRLSSVSHRPYLPYEFVVVNSPHLSTWSFPGGKIVLTRALFFELQNEAELAAVLSHEIAHATSRHHPKKDFESSYTKEQRQAADYHGMHYMLLRGYNPKAMLDLYKRLQKGGLSFKGRQVSQERVDEVEDALRLLNSETDIAQLQFFQERFEKEMGSLLQKRSFYSSFDQGVESLLGGDAKRAASLAQQALKGDPYQACIYGLLGKARMVKRRYTEAHRAFVKAISLDDHYYDHYLQHGLLLASLGDASEAKKSLERSLELFETGQAHQSLGQLYEKEGDIEGALYHLELAASLDQDLEKQVRQEIERILLPRNPEKFVQLVALVNSYGYLVVEAQNKSLLQVKDLVIEIALAPGFMDGRVWSLHFFEPIDQSSSQRQSTLIGPFKNHEEMRSLLQLRVQSAKASVEGDRALG